MHKVRLNWRTLNLKSLQGRGAGWAYLDFFYSGGPGIKERNDDRVI